MFGLLGRFSRNFEHASIILKENSQQSRSGENEPANKLFNPNGEARVAAKCDQAQNTRDLLTEVRNHCCKKLEANGMKQSDIETVMRLFELVTVSIRFSTTAVNDYALSSGRKLTPSQISGIAAQKKLLESYGKSKSGVSSREHVNPPFYKYLEKLNVVMKEGYGNCGDFRDCLLAFILNSNLPLDIKQRFRAGKLGGKNNDHVFVLFRSPSDDKDLVIDPWLPYRVQYGDNFANELAAHTKNQCVPGYVYIAEAKDYIKTLIKAVIVSGGKSNIVGNTEWVFIETDPAVELKHFDLNFMQRLPCENEVQGQCRDLVMKPLSQLVAISQRTP